MAKIKPFKGIRPKPELAGRVASKPYDVLNSEEAREETKDNPHSFLHITKAEIDLPADVDIHSQPVYDKAKENLEKFLNEGTLFQDNEEYYYIYRQVMNGKAQTGLVAASSIDDYFDDIIKKHEFTRPQKEQDRINHMKTTRLHSGPVFLTYPDVTEIDTLVDNIAAHHQPEYDFTGEDGVKHVLWLIKDRGQIEKLTRLFKEQVPFTYIADGHHRAASSAKVGRQLREEEGGNGEEEYNYFLTVLFPASQLRIIDYNRVVKDLNGMSEDRFMSALSEDFSIEPNEGAYKPEAAHNFGLYLNGKWYRMTAKVHTFDDNDPIKRLDVTILQNSVLEKILDIKDPRTDERVDFVGGIRGMKELEKRVNSGEMKAAFALYPVTIEQLINISDAGEVMPPKSTWFEPKLRSGLVAHKF